MITERGLGNGVSMLIFAGIVAQMPGGIRQLWDDQIAGESWFCFVDGNWICYSCCYCCNFNYCSVCYMGQQAERRLPIQYTRRTTTSPSSMVIFP